MKLSENCYKLENTANPISPNVFCADPTGVEYNGRLYIYGTNDHQQYEAVGDDGKNDYVHIKSIVMLSTDDMVNWEYHGFIDTAKIAPWIVNSWAPSVASRVEADGKTHFYLYFSNSGCGVGVLTAEHPLGPWSDPLGKPLIYQNMPGLENCPAPFDPGVCLDENGTGWLAFGGGTPPASNTLHTYTPKIVRLGKDMLSFDSDFVPIDAPYFFEASELNYENGTFIYTYSTDWQSRENWNRTDVPAPGICSMGCLTSKTPLDPESWQFRGGFFLNAGDSGMDWCNNHTHLIEYKGTRYILHHTIHIQERMKTKGGFRCMCVDLLPYTDTEFPVTKATREGVTQTQPLDPYKAHSGAEMFTCADMWYEQISAGKMAVKSLTEGAWTYIKGVDFGYGASAFTAEVKGKGRIEVRLDDISGEAVSFIEFDNADYAKVRSAEFSQFDGRNHNIYLVFSGADIELRSWQFTKGSEELRPEENISDTEIKYETLILTGQAENPGPSPSAFVEITGDGEYSVKSTSFEKDSEVLNFGYINVDPNAEYKVLVKSIGLETENGIVEVSVNAELDPSSGTANGLANGWMGAEIGSVVYGTEECGIVAAETTVDWIGYRFALIINGEETPFTSITYNVTVSGLELDG